MRNWRIKHVIFFFIIVVGIVAGVFRAFRTTPEKDLHHDHQPYRIARDGSWSNLALAEKGTNLLAFSNDLLFAIARSENVQFELFLVASDHLFPGLDHGQYDGILSSYQPTIKEWYKVSDPIYLTGPVLIVRADSQAKSLADMEGKMIGIQTGSSVVFNVSEYPDILITSYDSPLMALSNLDKNIIDGVILSAIPAFIYTTGLYSGRLKVISQPLTDEGIRLVTQNTPKGKSLIEIFNSGLKKTKDDKTYKTLLDKWNLKQG